VKTEFNYIDADWKRVKNHCRTTVNKSATDVEPTDGFKEKLLISEHSPIRLIEFDWTWEGIKSWVATHWSRHKFEKFISTQRDDRTSNAISRDEAPQNTPVNFDGYANAQQLIDVFRKRLCFQAARETRDLAIDFKWSLYRHEEAVANVLVPNCIYRCGCPEFKPCGHYRAFIAWAYSRGFDRDALDNISLRYSLYNRFLLGMDLTEDVDK